MTSSQENQLESGLIFPKTPSHIRVITGDEEIIGQTQDTFFDEIMDFVGYNPNAKRAFVEIQTQVLCNTYDVDTVQPTDNMMTFLLMQSHLTATILKWRDDMNWVNAYFHSYLTPELVTKLRRGVINET